MPLRSTGTARFLAFTRRPGSTRWRSHIVTVDPATGTYGVEYSDSRGVSLASVIAKENPYSSDWLRGCGARTIAPLPAMRIRSGQPAWDVVEGGMGGARRRRARGGGSEATDVEAVADAGEGDGQPDGVACGDATTAGPVAVGPGGSTEAAAEHPTSNTAATMTADARCTRMR
jgi:hypothetical protein